MRKFIFVFIPCFCAMVLFQNCQNNQSGGLDSSSTFPNPESQKSTDETLSLPLITTLPVTANSSGGGSGNGVGYDGKLFLDLDSEACAKAGVTDSNEFGVISAQDDGYYQVRENCRDIQPREIGPEKIPNLPANGNGVAVVIVNFKFHIAASLLKKPGPTASGYIVEACSGATPTSWAQVTVVANPTSSLSLAKYTLNMNTMTWSKPQENGLILSQETKSLTTGIAPVSTSELKPEYLQAFATPSAGFTNLKQAPIQTQLINFKPDYYVHGQDGSIFNSGLISSTTGFFSDTSKSTEPMINLNCDFEFPLPPPQDLFQHLR